MALVRALMIGAMLARAFPNPCRRISTGLRGRSMYICGLCLGPQINTSPASRQITRLFASRPGGRGRKGGAKGGGGGSRKGGESKPPKGADPKSRRFLDHYSRQAKAEGYMARSVYKLQEIDDKNGLFRKGQRVFDLGCAPGSWTQLAAEKVGEEGLVVGIDLTECGSVIQAIPNVLTIQGDIYEFEPTEEGYKREFDVLLSDMAPKTSGIKGLDADRSGELCMRALDLAKQLVKPEGAVVLKIFTGSSFQDVLDRCRNTFQNVKCVKPKGTRSESVETYILARKFKGR
ncbi:hypothetical protein AAMO2058_001561000 [Amorphochlora amoebiformis]